MGKISSLEQFLLSRHIDRTMAGLMADGAEKLEAFALVCCMTGAALRGNAGDTKDILLRTKKILNEMPGGPRPCPYVDGLLAELPPSI
jgi:hypothetical protein